jgi:hypothetical protein
MSQSPRHGVFEVARGDLLHLGGYAPGWYFDIDIPDGLTKGPYRTKAIARRMCTRWINDYERALRRFGVNRPPILTPDLSSTRSFPLP